LAKNDKKDVEELIENIGGTVDEILVILDEGCSDGTDEMAKKYDAKVLERNMDGDFGAQRNFAIENAKYDWIFMIDSDERCSSELLKSLQEITKSDVDYDGITILWKNYRDDNLVEVPRKLCLFKRHGYYKDKVHEKTQGLKNIVNLGDERKYLTHIKSKEDQIGRLNKYEQMIKNNLDSAKKSGDESKIAYFEYMLERHQEKKTNWLGDYI